MAELWGNSIYLRWDLFGVGGGGELRGERAMEWMIFLGGGWGKYGKRIYDCSILCFLLSLG